MNEDKPGKGGSVVFKVTDEPLETRPGDVRFKVGQGGSTMRGDELIAAEPGDFIFEYADGSEALRISGSGPIFVRGTEVDNDAEVYHALRAWLRAANATFGAGEGGGGDASLNRED